MRKTKTKVIKNWGTLVAPTPPDSLPLPLNIISLSRAVYKGSSSAAVFIAHKFVRCCLRIGKATGRVE